MKEKSEERKGFWLATFCSLLWGFLPIYWKSLIPIDSRVIIIYRILLVFVTALILAKTRYSWSEIFGPLKDRKLAFKFFMAGLIITVNWSTYIWAVNSGHIVQSSIGYYIEPLMVCLFGRIIFKDKITKYSGTAIALAAVAVVIILVHFRQVPGIALMLAITFSIYSAIKSTVDQPPLISLTYETIFFAPIALAVIIFIEIHDKGAIGVGHPYQYGLLMLVGLMTVIPLALFAGAAQRASMFVLGLTEYISPTIQLLLGVLLYGESVDRVQFLAFAIIWVGLAFFSYGELVAGRKQDAERQ
jgi:chloramphenicol-sensitive protein RarD